MRKERAQPTGSADEAERRPRYPVQYAKGRRGRRICE